VLDNFEQLLEGAAILSNLRADCPELKLLVTSRAPLHLSGEQEYPVPPLLLPDPDGEPEVRLLSQYEAVALFIERAQAVKSDFALTTDNAAVVLEICRRLDGLPLPIELAAARIRVLSPQAILDRLGQRLRLLTGGARDLPARQKTLRDTLDWSYELLEPAQRTLFARLAVFVGGRDLETIESVCDPDGDLGIDLLDGLTALIDNNLLRHEELEPTEPRFVMLETIHEYAHERLEEDGEIEILRRRHAEYFVALAEEADSKLRGEEQVAWLERLERERDNIRAALLWAASAGEAELELRLAGAMRVFWRVRGYLTEGRAALEDALERADGQRPALRAPALYGAGVLALRQGDHAAARALSEESLVLYREIGDKRGAARTLHVLGSVAMGERRYDEARALFEESEPLTREVGDLHLLAITVLDLGDVALNQGLYERAAQSFEDSLAIFREIADIDGTAIALYNLGSVALHLGQIERAPALLAESLGLFRELGYREGIAYSLEGLAAVAAEHGDAEDAARLLGAADALSEAMSAALEPAERDRHNRTVETVRARLGAEGFAAAWERGRAMDPDAAAEYALRVSA
jgi:predicted ATPase